MSFFPCDREILNSSIWADESPATFKVWFYLMLRADPRTGIVPDTDPAIALHCGLELDQVASALEQFEQPDRFSRTETKEGRRIERVNGRIRLVNYKKYTTKDYSTPRVQKFRKRVSETMKRVSKRPSVTETTDTDTDTDTDKAKTTTPTSETPTFPQDLEVWWDDSPPSNGELMCSPDFSVELEAAYPTIPRERIREAWLKFSMMLADPDTPKRLERLIKKGTLGTWVKARIREDFARLLAKPENTLERIADQASDRRRNE